MAHSFSGDPVTDQMQQIDLSMDAAELAFKMLRPGGACIIKARLGAGLDGLKTTLSSRFREVKYVKPGSSRKESPEVYLLCRKYQKTRKAKGKTQ